MGAETVSARAFKHLESQAYYRAFSLSLGILQEMMNLVAMADDSSGDISSVIAESLDLRYDSVPELSGPESDQAFKILLKESGHSRHEIFNDPQVAILPYCSRLRIPPNGAKPWKTPLMSWCAKNPGEITIPGILKKKWPLSAINCWSNSRNLTRPGYI